MITTFLPVCVDVTTDCLLVLYIAKVKVNVKIFP